MDLHEEYIQRRKLKAPIIKFADRANLILKSKSKDNEWAWLHVNISSNGDNNHPQKWSFVVSGNPNLYTTPDFQHFSNYSKVIKEKSWEWDQYEPELMDWIKESAGNYTAITSSDAIFVAWEMFATNYDAWIAHFMPFRLQEFFYSSLEDGKKRQDRLNAIKKIEDFIQDRYDKVFVCWRNIRSAIEQKNYADWLAKIINEYLR